MLKKIICLLRRGNISSQEGIYPREERGKVKNGRSHGSPHVQMVRKEHSLGVYSVAGPRVFSIYFIF